MSNQLKHIQDMVTKIFTDKNPTQDDFSTHAKSAVESRNMVNRTDSHVRAADKKLEFSKLAEGTDGHATTEVEKIRERMEELREMKDELGDPENSEYFQRNLERRIKRGEFEIQRDGQKHLSSLNKIEERSQKAIDAVKLEGKNAVADLQKKYELQLKSFEKNVQDVKSIKDKKTIDFLNQFIDDPTSNFTTIAENEQKAVVSEAKAAIKENLRNAKYAIESHVTDTVNKYEDILHEVKDFRSQLSEAGVKSLESAVSHEGAAVAKAGEKAAEKVKFGTARSVLMGAMVLLGGHGLLKMFSTESTGQDKAVGVAEVAGAGIGGTLVYKNFTKATEKFAQAASHVHGL